MAPSSSPDVLLLMPPLTHLLCHTDIGIPQLTAYLRREGYTVAQVDLNAALLYRRLSDPEQLLALAAELSPAGRRRLLGMLPLQRARVAELTVSLGRYGVTGQAARDLYWDLLQYLADCERWRPRRAEPLGPQKPDEVALTGAVTALAEALKTSLFLRRALVSIIHDELVNPLGYAPDQLRQAVARPAPRLLVELLEQQLGPVVQQRPRVVGLTVHSTAQLVPALQICRWVEARCPDACTVIGGPWAVAAGDLLLNEPLLLDHVHGVCVCEGEQALAALAAGGRAALEHAPGLIHGRGLEVKQNPPPPPLPLERLPAPALDQVTADIAETRAPLRTVRGCYWGRCVFCHHLNRRQLNSPEDGRCQELCEAQLEAMTRMLVDLGARHDRVEMTLADNATPPAALQKIARRIRQAGLKVGWETLARFDEGFTEGLCGELAEAGCQRIFFGLETADDRELRRLGKGIDRELALRCLGCCAEAGINAIVFLLDYPSAPPDAWRRSLEFVLANEPIISAFIPARFVLGRNARAFVTPEALGLQVSDAARSDFSVFDLPFLTHQWQPLEAYDDLTEEYTLRFLAARAARRAGR